MALSELELVPSVKLLGLEVDSELPFNSHLKKLCKRLSQRIGILKKIWSCLSMRQSLLFYNTMIRSVLHYVSTIWTRRQGESSSCFKVTEKSSNFADFGVIFDADNQASRVKLFNRLQWLPFCEESQNSQMLRRVQTYQGWSTLIYWRLFSLVSNIVALQDIVTLIFLPEI